MSSTFFILVQQFFDSLRTQRNLSAHTLAAYRDSFRLLLRFLADKKRVAIDQLTLDQLTPEALLAFLEHLEKGRGNTIRTRNARLAAIHAFARFTVTQKAPDFLVAGQRILAIPCKRTVKPVLGFMSRAEIDAILAATDQATRVGRRDHLLFTLLYNTGGRISEILRLQPSEINNRTVRLHGKGRKERDVPIWPATQKEIKEWCRTNKIGSTQYLFANRHGTPITRKGAALRLSAALRSAAKACATLRGRKITLHTFRHATAMHLLQSGVALPIIALWLGHEHPVTTHGYVEADLKMKQRCLDTLERLPRARRQTAAHSHLMAFLEAL
ncbi:MAG: tyrosine-type recombinase/integrase [Lacunisphaera sp.]